MTDKDKKKTCYQCCFRGSVPGSAHSSCSFEWSRNLENAPEGDSHGIKKGWWVFPWNYDPGWMIGQCKEFKQK
jgi:hypothetical protein